MSRPRMLQGSGPPSFCFHCGKQLQRVKGKGLGLFYFNHIQIKGNDKPSRVHGFPCTEFAIQNGATFVAGAIPRPLSQELYRDLCRRSYTMTDNCKLVPVAWANAHEFGASNDGFLTVRKPSDFFTVPLYAEPRCDRLAPPAAAQSPDAQGGEAVEAMDAARVAYKRGDSSADHYDDAVEIAGLRCIAYVRALATSGDANSKES